MPNTPEPSNDEAEFHHSRLSTLAILIILIFFAGAAWMLRTWMSAPQRAETQPERTTEPARQSDHIFNWVGIISNLEEYAVLIRSVATPDRAVKRAIITPATAILRLTFVPTPGKSSSQPSFTPQEKLAELKSLKIGMNVEALAAEDINSRNEFRAVHIRILP